MLTQIDVRNETSTHRFLKSVKKTPCFPTRTFQSVTVPIIEGIPHYSSCLTHKASLILYETDLRIPNQVVHKYFHGRYGSFRSKLKSNGFLYWTQPQVFRAYILTRAIFKELPSFSAQRAASSGDKDWLEISSILFTICRYRSSILLSL